tara:strand:+ start:1261 stop:1866 length:606 start_codon:yes stop_codon:yes gene_type:complete
MSATLNTTNIKHASSGSNNIVLAADGSTTISNLSGGGKILQVVTAEKTTQTSVNGTTHADLGVTATITPTSASSKILVEYNINMYMYRSCSGCYEANASIQVLRGSTVILVPYSLGNSPQSSGSGYGHADYFMSSGVGNTNLGTFLRNRHGYRLIDTPNTTSSTTYKLQGAIGYGGYLYINKTDSASQTPKSNIILMEVAA